MNFTDKIKRYSFKDDIESLNIGVSKTIFSDYKNNKRPIKAIHALTIAWELDIHLKNSDKTIQYKLIYSKPEKKFFWQNLDNIFPGLVELKKFFALCELDINTLMHNRGRNLSPTFKEARVIATHLNCSLFLLFSKELNIECVQKNLKTNFNKKVHIPNEFILNSGSKMRTFAHLISYSKELLEKDLVREILSRMQISDEAVRNYSKDINIYTFEKFYSYILRLGVTERFILNAGANSINFKKNKSHFGQLIRPRDVKDVYRQCLNIISTVDVNFEYIIQEVTETYCIVKSGPKELTENEKVNSGLLSKYVFLFRIGHLISIPKYFDINKGNIEQTTYSFDEKTGEAEVKIVF